MPKTNWIKANWPAPNWLHAGTSFRNGGYSHANFAGLNLGTHVGDDAASVLQNRQRLGELLSLPAEPVWLKQVHGREIIHVNGNIHSFEADAAYTSNNGTVVAVLTADCLPLLLFAKEQRCIAAVHVGWRGFCRGIIDNAVRQMQCPPMNMMAWIGPCIRQQNYEVDETVYRACTDRGQQFCTAFATSRPGHWLADLPALVKQELSDLEVKDVYDCGECTFANSHRYYSYRRDGKTGRMASLIWMND